jgi:type IV pilus assembly protein PilX
MQQPQSTLSRQRGVVMIAALLLLLVATILAFGMFHAFGTEQKIAGNVRDKGRALLAAESTEQYAEWWMLNGAPPTSVCNAIVSSTVGQVCSNPIATPAAVPWAVGVSYLPPDPTTGLTMPLNGANGPAVGTYFGSPLFYVTDLGPAQGGEVYQIDAMGYGGTQNTVAVVESTYVVKQSGAQCTNPLGC